MEVKLAVYRFKDGKRITQQELADAVGTSRNTISNLERGIIPHGATTLVKIGNFLDVDPRKIILLP